MARADPGGTPARLLPIIGDRHSGVTRVGVTRDGPTPSDATGDRYKGEAIDVEKGRCGLRWLRNDDDDISADIHQLHLVHVVIIIIIRQSLFCLQQTTNYNTIAQFHRASSTDRYLNPHILHLLIVCRHKADYEISTF